MRVVMMTLGVVSTAAIMAAAGVVMFVLVDASEVTASSVSTTTGRILKTDASIAETPVSLKSGDTQIIGLRIENPPGFSRTTAIHLPQVSATTDASKSGPNRIFIAKMVITQPEIRLEVRDGQANLSRFLRATNAGERSAADPLHGMTFSIGEILLEDGEVLLVADSLGDEPVSTPLPDSRMTDIGTTEDGISASDLGAEIIAFIAKSTERASRRIDITAIANERGLPKPDLDLKTLLSE